MGQYFEIANLDKKEKINPLKFDDGMKLLEFGSGQGTMLGLAFLLRQSTGRGGGDAPTEAFEKFDDVLGRWAGDRVAIVGDYDETDIGEEVWNDIYTDISDRVVQAVLTDDWIRKKIEKRRRDDFVEEAQKQKTKKLDKEV